MSKLLSDYKAFRVPLSDLESVFGSDLLNAENAAGRETVHAGDLVLAIEKYLLGEITKQNLVDWVNTLWFCDKLYVYDDSQCDSIASVMAELETLDEDGASYSRRDFGQMIAALKSNRDYARQPRQCKQ